MERREDIIELLAAVQSNIDDLDCAYIAAAKDENLKSVMRPLIKSSLEHLRSCLEYSAQDTHARIFGGSRRLYFPYGKDVKSFLTSISNNLPGLEKRNPHIYRLFSDVQPFSCGDEWLTDLCKHTNFNKHDSLTKQERVNSDESTTKIGNFIHMSGRGNVTISNSYFNGLPIGFGKPVTIDSRQTTEEIQKVFPKSIVKVEREFSWVEFRFHGTPTDALRLIKKSHGEISYFTNSLYEMIKSK